MKINTLSRPKYVEFQVSKFTASITKNRRMFTNSLHQTSETPGHIARVAAAQAAIMHAGK